MGINAQQLSKIAENEEVMVLAELMLQVVLERDSSSATRAEIVRKVLLAIQTITISLSQADEELRLPPTIHTVFPRTSFMNPRAHAQDYRVQDPKDQAMEIDL